MNSGINELEKKLGDTSKLLKQFQVQNDQLEKKYDGLLNEQNIKLANVISEKVELKSKLKSIEESKLVERLENLELQEKRLGFGANKIENSVEAKKFDSWLRKKGGSMEEMEIKALSSLTNADGGFFIRPSFWSNISKKIFETSAMRQIANIQIIGNKSYKVLEDVQSLDSGWVGEGGSVAQTNTAQINEIEIPTYKQYAYPKISEELLEDSEVNIEAWLEEKLAEKFACMENSAFIIGDGSSKPKGILSYTFVNNNTYTNGNIEYVPSGVAATITSDSLIDLQGALKEIYQPRAVFLMHRTTFTNILKLKDTEGKYLFNADCDLNNEFKLLQKPVKFFADMPIIASGAYAVAYGDFQSAYTIVDRKELNILRDPYLSKGYILYYTTKRVGGAVNNFEAYKVLKLSVS